MNGYLEELRNHIRQIIDQSTNKITPLALKKHLSSESRYSKEQIKFAVKGLIADGSLMYTNCFGTTYLEKSIKTPIRLSKHVILKPPEVDFRCRKQEVVVNIQTGAAFGMGDHPSTRLAISGIDFLLGKIGSGLNRYESNMLDIGTGSGILAITALKLGIQKAAGIDIDPCAVQEAKLNADTNGLTHRFSVSMKPIHGLLDTYNIITANLRYPTLIRLFNDVFSRLKDRGFIIMSGIKTDEMCPIRKVYSKDFFNYIWSEQDKGWACFVIQKREEPSGG